MLFWIDILNFVHFFKNVFSLKSNINFYLSQSPLGEFNCCTSPLYQIISLQGFPEILSTSNDCNASFSLSLRSCYTSSFSVSSFYIPSLSLSSILPVFSIQLLLFFHLSLTVSLSHVIPLTIFFYLHVFLSQNTIRPSLWYVCISRSVSLFFLFQSVSCHSLK